MIIDCHVHLYPPEVAADPRGWSASRGERHWAELAAPLSGARLQGWPDVDTLLADMDAAGVEQAVLLGWYWENQNTCIEQNDWHIDWVKRHPDRLRAFATVQPGAGAAAAEELQRAVESGLCGLGELSPAAQGFSMEDPGWIALVERAVSLDVPVNLHVNEPVGRRYSGRLQDSLDDMVGLAGRFPDLKLILAHWGGLLPFFELNRWVGPRMRNVYYDTAASPLLYDKQIFRAVIDRIGPERVLYGSDYPLRLYPKEQQEPDFGRFLEEIDSAGLAETEKRLMLGENMVRLLGRQSRDGG